MLTEAVIPFDERRDFISLKDEKAMIAFAVEHWIHSARRAIQQKGRFAVALSGGSTPKAIYRALAETKEVEWEKVFLFWSDERAVPPTHPESNYYMAMEAGLKQVSIPKSQIFRMVAEEKIEKNAKEYEEKIRHNLGSSLFDLVMLGMGEDGHTASLFPGTEALRIEDRLATSNFAGPKKGWRMTLTFPCLEQSAHLAIYAAGKKKGITLAQVLTASIDSPWPASRLGTPSRKALWILDQEAANELSLLES